MQTDDIRTPSEEPAVQLQQQDEAGGLRRHDAESSPEQVDDHQAESQQSATTTALPFWLAEKFYWVTANSGNQYLRPLDHFLNAVTEDAPKFKNYGINIVYPDGEIDKTDESSTVETLKAEIGAVLQSVEQLAQEERQAVERALANRVTDNLVYAAIVQFEIDNWVARAAAAGTSPDQQGDFEGKKARRDRHATVGAALGIVIRELVPDADFSPDALAKAARRIIYRNADIETRRQKQPKQADAERTAEVQAAVMDSRPI